MTSRNRSKGTLKINGERVGWVEELEGTITPVEDGTRPNRDLVIKTHTYLPPQQAINAPYLAGTQSVNVEVEVFANAKSKVYQSRLITLPEAHVVVTGNYEDDTTLVFYVYETLAAFEAHQKQQEETLKTLIAVLEEKLAEQAAKE